MGMDKGINMEDRTNCKKILIVDDEEAIQRILRRIVKKVGRGCATAASAEEARYLLKEEAFDLILCDIRLPGESGLDLVGHIVSDYPETAVIMVSGVEDPKIVEKALEVGAYGYIIKPFNPSEVIINISSALRRQRLEIESRRHREDLEQLVEKRTASLRKAMQGIIRAISLTVESRDPYTSGHQHRVGTLSAAIAEEMGLPKDRIEGIRLAGMIHDLGKISVPAEILSKPTRLNDMEFGLIKTHPQVGYDILKRIDFPWPVAEITYQHHERLDGTGYPRRLKGEEILLEAKIMAVADVVEAMASHRPYRPSLGLDKALEEISDNAGKLYDPEVAQACRRVFRERGFSFDL